MQDLPELTQQLNSVDVESLNEVMTRLPALMDTVANLQEQVNSLMEFLSNFSLGGLLSGGLA